VQKPTRNSMEGEIVSARKHSKGKLRKGKKTMSGKKRNTESGKSSKNWAVILKEMTTIKHGKFLWTQRTKNDGKGARH